MDLSAGFCGAGQPNCGLPRFFKFVMQPVYFFARKLALRGFTIYSQGGANAA